MIRRAVHVVMGLKFAITDSVGFAYPFLSTSFVPQSKQQAKDAGRGTQADRIKISQCKRLQTRSVWVLLRVNKLNKLVKILNRPQGLGLEASRPFIHLN